MAPLSAGITHRLLRARAVASEVARAAAVVAGVRRPTVSRRLWALPARRAARGGHVPKGTVCVCVCARARVCVRACVCARVCVKVARTLSCARAARSCCTALASSKPTRNGRCRRSCDTTSLSLRPPLRPPLCSPLCSPLCFSLCVRSPLCSSELRFDLRGGSRRFCDRQTDCLAATTLGALPSYPWAGKGPEKERAAIL